ncbi:MAG: CarD family transcriptional regulator, partial [Chloroflexota bacterium]
GELVVHPAHGMGQIVKIEEKRLFGGEARPYYEVATQKNTVWVPVEAGGGVRIRPLTTKRDLAQYRNILKSRPAPLNKDHRQRHLELADRLKKGSFQVMCEVVRDLTARGWQKSLNEADAASLRKIQEQLCQEWAVVEGVSINQAAQEIGDLLLETQQMYK